MASQPSERQTDGARFEVQTIDRNPVSMWPISSFSLILLIALSMAVSSDSTTVKKFLRCLPTHATPSVSDLVYTRRNASFSTVLQSYNRNLRFLTPQTTKPLLIVTPLDASHVQAAVLCAKQLGLQIRVRSGGHDYEGLSYRSDVAFVLIDLFNLRRIDVQKDAVDYFAWVQAGATVGELYHRIAQESQELAFPASVCPTVGVGGLFSGGGYGNLMRKYGLSVDNIIDATFVDVNGVLHDRQSMGEDLFWAIRGGGASSFGIVISWKIKLVPVPKTVTVFNVKKTMLQGAVDVVYRWQSVAPNLPDELFIRTVHSVEVSTIREGEFTVQVSFIGMFLGETKPLISLVNKKFPELGLKASDCSEKSWIQSTLYWYDFPEGTAIEALLDRPKSGSVFFKSRSDYVKKPITKKGIASIWRKMIEFHNDHVVMQWNPYGGRMAEIPESATPFPHRAGNLFLIQYPLAWIEEGIESSKFNLNMSKSLYDFMTPFVSCSPRESYLNYRDIDLGANPSHVTNYAVAGEYGRKYFKDNFDRLVQVKTKVDPDNFFRNEQSIPTLPKPLQKKQFHLWN